jgi:hypothetical protein
MASTPSAPDPKEQANANNSQSAWASMFNNVSGNANQVNPYGQTTNAISGYVDYTDPYTGTTSKIPQWTQTTTLSPQQQAIYEQESAGKLGFGQMANSLLKNVSGTLSKPLDTAGLANWRGYDAQPGLVKPDENYRRQIEDKMRDSYIRGIQPQYEAEDAQLAARGQSPGGKMAYQTQAGRYDAADEAARQRFTQAGGEARSAAEGENQVSQQDWLNRNLIADQSNSLRQQQLAENIQLRTQPLNELLAMFGLGQTTVPNAPSWQGSQVNAFDAAGAMNKQYEAELQQAAAKNQGIFGLAGALGQLAFA